VHCQAVIQSPAAFAGRHTEQPAPLVQCPQQFRDTVIQRFDQRAALSRGAECLAVSGISRAALFVGGIGSKPANGLWQAQPHNAANLMAVGRGQTNRSKGVLHGVDHASLPINQRAITIE